jgi:hypothetical protein
VESVATAATIGNTARIRAIMSEGDGKDALVS